VITPEKTLEINNRKYQYLEIGEGDKTIIFIHGLGSSKEMYPKFFKEFLPLYRCIFLDLPGHNKLPFYNFDSLADIANYVIDFVEHNKIKNFSLVGFSFGGLVAIKSSKLFKDKGVKIKVVAWASPLEQSFLTIRSKTFLKIVDGIDKVFYKKLPKSMYFRLLVSILGIKAKNYELESFQNFENDLLDKFARFIPKKAINTEDMRILYLFGTKDPLISSKAFEKTKILGKYQHKYLINKGGHYYKKEGREEAIGKILKFISF